MAEADADAPGPEMDQETARTLFAEGATLLFLNVPPGTEFGIDCNSWTTGEKFKGVKMIPPGVHFIHYSAVDRREQNRAPRMGFFRAFARRELVVLSWSPREEDAVEHPLGAGREEAEAEYRERLRSLDPNLAPYPYAGLKKWVSLTDHLTEAVVRTLMPANGRIFSAPQLVADGPSRTAAERASLAESQSAGEASSAEDLLPKMHSQPGTEVRFSPIPRRNYPDGASPAQITRCSLDLSYTLEALLRAHYPDHPTGILGELQFAFVCFLVGQVFDGFEQWKRLVHLLCSAEESTAARPDLYHGFLSVLHFQLKEVPTDFFVDIVSRNNFLTSTLRELFANLQGPGVDAGLGRKGRRFQQSLTKRFKWDFEAEPDEDAPVVVQL